MIIILRSLERTAERHFHKEGRQPLGMVRQRVEPAQPGKTGKVRVVGSQFGIVFDGQSCEVRVTHKIAGGIRRLAAIGKAAEMRVGGLERNDVGQG